jgi:hypothetical protein
VESVVTGILEVTENETVDDEMRGWNDRREILLLIDLCLVFISISLRTVHLRRLISLL